MNSTFSGESPFISGSKNLIPWLYFALSGVSPSFGPTMTDTALITFFTPLKYSGTRVLSLVISPTTKSMSGPSMLLAFSSFLTNNRTGNPFLRKMLTTLLPTPPVAPATSTIPEVSIAFTGSLGDGPDSFSIRNSKNLAGDGGPLKKYNVLTNLPKSHPCFPASAKMGTLYVLKG
ncbi:hypothetical protein CsSME_00031708 [Camellia sinensis var. sinensis]